MSCPGGNRLRSRSVRGGQIVLWRRAALAGGGCVILDRYLHSPFTGPVTDQRNFLQQPAGVFVPGADGKTAGLYNECHHYAGSITAVLSRVVVILALAESTIVVLNPGPLSNYPCRA